jgi:hypothetical protein
MDQLEPAGLPQRIGFPSTQCKRSLMKRTPVFSSGLGDPKAIPSGAKPNSTLTESSTRFTMNIPKSSSPAPSTPNPHPPPKRFVTSTTRSKKSPSLRRSTTASSLLSSCKSLPAARAPRLPPHPPVSRTQGSCKIITALTAATMTGKCRRLAHPARLKP